MAPKSLPAEQSKPSSTMGAIKSVNFVNRIVIGALNLASLTAGKGTTIEPHPLGLRCEHFVGGTTHHLLVPWANVANAHLSE